MSKTTVSFEATPAGTWEEVTLTRSRRGGLLGRESSETISFDEWVQEAPVDASAALGRILQALGDGARSKQGDPLVTAEANRALLHPELVATLSEPEALSLGLPPVARLALNLQSVGVAHQPQFAIEMRWTKANGLPARVVVSGARARADGKDWRIAEPIYSTLDQVDRVNKAATIDDRHAALAALRQIIGDEERQHIKPDGFIERMRLSYAAGFSLDLKPSATGFDFDPVLFSPERLKETNDGVVLDETADSLLPPAQQQAFAGRFRQGSASRRAYLLDGGHILFLDPILRDALAVVRTAQAGSVDERRQFASNPQRKITEALAAVGFAAAQASALFIETQQFSERVSGIDVWRKPVLPWIKPKPNSWLPEAFGLRVGEPPNDTLVELTPEDIEPTLQAVEAALAAGEPTVVMNGTSVPATEQARSALADLAELRRAADDNHAGAAPPPIASQRYFLQVSDNLENVAYAPLATAPASTNEPPPQWPEAVRTEPKPHQQHGFRWLVSCWRAAMPGVLLADDMGLGKTFQALSFLAWLRENKVDNRPILIVAPTGLLANWKAEIEQHLSAGALGTVVGAYGAGLSRMREFAGRDIELGKASLGAESWSDAGVVLTTFETMRDYHLSFARQRFSVVIYDEVQKIKNPASQMTRAAKTINGRFQLAMTGTPVENRLQDLWSIYDVVHPGLLGSSRTFEGEYPSSDYDKLRELNATLTEPQASRPALLLRRMKDDCLDGLPAKHIHALPTDMPPSQAAAYNRVIQRAVAARGTGNRGHMLEILHMLRGVSLHPSSPETGGDTYFEQSARLQATFATLDAISNTGEKALVFCESLAMQALLALEIRRRYALDHDVARIHGGITGDARQAAVDEFQRRPGGFDVMILSPKAGGVGLTLTAANHVIHLSRWWNPAVEDQATDRVFRIGQNRDVHVYLPQAVHPDPTIASSSFDLKLDELMRRKRELSRGLLIPGEEEADANALFDEVIGSETADHGPTAEAEPGADQPKATERLSERPVLSAPAIRPQAQAPLRTVPRHVFEPRQARDFAIFTLPLEGQHIAELTLRDPYVCSKPRNRAALIDFMKVLTEATRRIDAVWCQTLDADSVDSWSESDVVQRDDIEKRWRSAFSTSPSFRLTQLSKRVHRSFHARELKAVTTAGTTIIWDLDNGVDGVMLPDRRCVVNCSFQDVA